MQLKITGMNNQGFRAPYAVRIRDSRLQEVIRAEIIILDISELMKILESIN